MGALLFRPRSKLASSVEYFGAHNVPCVGVSLIDTQPLPNKVEQLYRALQMAPASAAVIVTSTVAANLMVDYSRRWPDLVFYTVGQASAEVLSKAGVKAHHPATETSEGLLEMLKNRHIEHAKWWIVKGKGGRGLLANALASQSQPVESVDLYQRIRLTPPHNAADWKAEEIACIIASSGETVEAAFDHYPHSWLRALPWIVVSQRIADIATTLGISDIHISNGASDAALVNAVKALRET